MTNDLKILRHSAAELLAISVLSLFPKVQLVNGEATDLGFYYDFFFPDPINEEQFPFIEERMYDFVRQGLSFTSMEMMRKSAIELFKHHRQDLKAVLLKENVETLVHVCQIGHFYDLAYPPFVETTKEIKAIKLLQLHSLKVSLPGRPNLTLTRIQGTAFPDNVSLKQYLKSMETAKACDHRKWGPQLELFTQLDESCPGCWTWLPKGFDLRKILLDYWTIAHQTQGYNRVSTPNALKNNGLHTRNEAVSIQFGLEHTYPLSSDKVTLHAAIYKLKQRSYRDLPIRYAEYDEVYGQGKEVHQWGLLRARSWIGDYAHTFCLPEQVSEELISSLHFINKTVKIVGLEAQWRLITKSQKFKKTPKKWDEVQDTLVKALNICGFDYSVDKESKEYYGPAIEVRFIDVLGREWKGPSICVDLYHAEELGLSYHGTDDRMHRTTLISRSTFGSLERFIALLIEENAREGMAVDKFLEQMREKFQN